MFRVLFTLLVMCWSSAVAQIDFEPRLNLSLSMVFGTQDNLIDVGLSASGIIQNSTVALELNGGIGGDFFLTKYGAFTKGKSLNLEGYFITGSSGNRKNVPYYSSDFIMPSFAMNQNGLQGEFPTFSGGGLGVIKTIIKGGVKHLANQQWIILVRARTAANRLIITRIKNDFKVGFLRGGGTDHGQTGSFYAGYSILDNNNCTHTIGANFDMFTPKADYGRNPTNNINSSDGSHPVLYTLKPFGNLFHGNLFGSYHFLSPYFAQYIGLGIDSQKLGGNVQNILHDSFGLYPRYPWDMTKRNKLFIQLKSTLTNGY
jgi:hypothetical protein